MSNIRKAFENGKAFIPFITCGDPDLGTTAAVVRAAAENGADLIELGIPFSGRTGHPGGKSPGAYRGRDDRQDLQSGT